MECERLGAARIGRVLFEVYGDDTGDDPPQRLINFYKSSRACLRAKLTIWHVQELQESAWPQWRERANDYLRLAEHYALQLL